MGSVGRCGLMAAAATIIIIGGALAPEGNAQQLAVGDAAIDGKIVQAKGAWSRDVKYSVDDLVTSRGSTWRSKENDNKGKVPGQTAPTSTAKFWELFARGFDPTGAWKASEIYHADDLVIHQGTTFRATRTNRSKIPTTVPTTGSSLRSRVTKATKATRAIKATRAPAVRRALRARQVLRAQRATRVIKATPAPTQCRAAPDLRRRSTSWAIPIPASSPPARARSRW